MTQLVWFRRDLRIEDNPAWSAASAAGEEIVALFVIDPDLWQRVSHRRQAMLGAHLRALDTQLQALGGALRVEQGSPSRLVPSIAREVGAGAVHINRDVTPFAIARDNAVSADTCLVGHDGQYIHPAGSITKRDGDPYQVFTPFWRTWQRTPLPLWPVTPPDSPVSSKRGLGIPDTGVSTMAGGAAAALDRLERFAASVDGYVQNRNRPDHDGTSRLSADLKWGTLSPRTVLDLIGDHTEGRMAFIRQLAWREFYAHLLLAYPQIVDSALKPQYDRIGWNNDDESFKAWKLGMTGYPLVDAGMRQLAQEGYIHNRVRMIVASFLVKDLLIDWRRGERYLRRHLLDADVPQNVGNWQWVAGSGADAAPYFRVFNPVLQSQKFDPNGTYIKRWLPELAGLANPEIHNPAEAAPDRLAEAGVVLGANYPFPVVEHSFARQRAIATYQAAVRA